MAACWVLTDMESRVTPAAAFRAYFSWQVATSSEGPAAQQLKTAILGSGKKVRLPLTVQWTSGRERQFQFCAGGIARASFVPALPAHEFRKLTFFHRWCTTPSPRLSRSCGRAAPCAAALHSPKLHQPNRSMQPPQRQPRVPALPLLLLLMLMLPMARQPLRRRRQRRQRRRQQQPAAGTASS